MPAEGAFSILTTAGQAGQRLDTIVALSLAECSRALAATLIRNGAVRVQGALKKPGYKVKAGERIEGRVPPSVPTGLQPEPIPLQILFEDDQVVVLNKQPGLVVHPAPGHFSGTLVNGLLHRYPKLEGVGLERRPGIVHRLDKDTSGVLVVAKNGAALNRLAQQFKARQVTKTYLALVYGRMVTDAGEISLPVGRHPVDRKKMSVHSRRGRAAVTRWQLKERLDGLTLVEIDLKTGRTHQIRVHLAAKHHPIVGDPVYCTPKSARQYQAGMHLSNRSMLLLAGVQRQMLHAWQIAFDHPRTSERLCIRAPLPDDMETLLTALRQETPRS